MTIDEDDDAEKALYRAESDLLVQQLQSIREGMARAEVVQIFSEVCWEPILGGLSQIDAGPGLSALEERLSNPLTTEHARALKEAIHRLQLVTVIREKYPEATPFMQPYIDSLHFFGDPEHLVVGFIVDTTDASQIGDLYDYIWSAGGVLLPNLPRSAFA